jgi:hypothetical protein
MTNQEEKTRTSSFGKYQKKRKEGKRYIFASEAIASFLDDDTTWLSNCRAIRQMVWFAGNICFLFGLDIMSGKGKDRQAGIR